MIFMQFKIIFLTLLTVACGVAGQALFKYGAQGQNINDIQAMIKILLSPAIFIAAVLYAASIMTWLYVLSKAALNHVYPIQALAFPLVLIVSIFLFKESVPINRWIGVALIFAGVIISTKHW